MKKAFAVLAALACTGLSATAYAAETTGGNIVDDVLNGAEDVVDGVVSGAEDIVTPGDSDSVPENSTDNSIVAPPATNNNSAANNAGNVNTGVPALELAALGTAAVGGLAAMAFTIRKKK